MIKVYFTCPWQSDESITKKIKSMTPENKGIWKNIEFTNILNEANYLIVLDDTKLKKELLVKFPIENIIHFIKENPSIFYSKSFYRCKIFPKLTNKFLLNYFYSFTSAHFLNKTYDELKKLDYPNKNKNLSCIVSSKGVGHHYRRRKDFIINFSNKNEKKIDVYGSGWGKELGVNYRGSLGNYHQESYKVTSKFNGLIDYKYSICLENNPTEDIVSEKITDAILSWSVPIYSGPEITKKYFPKNSFYLIDINNNEIEEDIIQIINKKVDIESLREARELILEKYNIWEQIYQIIDNKEEYEKNYRIK